MNTLKRTVSFLDANSHRVKLEVGITLRNGYPEFTVMGWVCGSWGQCLSSIKPRTHNQGVLMRLWEDYHLKDVSVFPDNVSFHPSFEGHVNGVLDEVEAEEKERAENAPVLTGDEATLEQMGEYGIDESMLDACKAYLDLRGWTDLADFEENYSGEYNSDEDFAMDMAEQIGDIDPNAKWPHNCIDWECASRELMQDYMEQDGFYFRN